MSIFAPKAYDDYLKKEDHNLKGNTRVILEEIANFQKYNPNCYPTHFQLAKKCRCSISTIKRHVRKLVDMRLVIVKRLKHHAKKFMTYLVYQITDKIIPNSLGFFEHSSIWPINTKYINTDISNTSHSQRSDNFYTNQEWKEWEAMAVPTTEPRRKPLPAKTVYKIPHDFKPSQEHKDFCAVHGLELEKEQATFVEKNQKKGTAFTNVPRAFLGWLKKAKHFLQTPDPNWKPKYPILNTDTSSLETQGSHINPQPRRRYWYEVSDAYNKAEGPPKESSIKKIQVDGGDWVIDYDGFKKPKSQAIGWYPGKT